MKKMFTIILLSLLVVLSVLGQGTFTYDQQSADENTGGGIVYIQANQPIGQSFIPSLGAVGFVRLYVEGTLGTVLSVNLRSDSITGTILASSHLVTLTNDIVPTYQNFIFATTPTVTPGTAYYFQPVVQSGLGIVIGYNYGYAGGMEYINGTAQTFYDLWFREGLYTVPEPSAAGLVLLGGGMLLYCCRQPSRRTPTF
jgi:hypothetical protein